MVNRSVARSIVKSRRLLKKPLRRLSLSLTVPLPLPKRPFIFFFLSPLREPIACSTLPPSLYSAPSILSRSLLFITYLPFFLFFNAEAGIRDGHVTEVQTCALPISVDYRTHDVVDEVRRISGEQHPIDLAFD